MCDIFTASHIQQLFLIHTFVLFNFKMWHVTYKWVSKTYRNCLFNLFHYKMFYFSCLTRLKLSGHVNFLIIYIFLLFFETKPHTGAWLYSNPWRFFFKVLKLPKGRELKVTIVKSFCWSTILTFFYLLFSKSMYFEGR